MMTTSPRDPGVDAILTAETVLGQFRTLLPRLTSVLPADVSVAMGEAQSLYPELWANLDRARGHLRDRGVDVPVYDEARARQPAAMLGVDVKLRERNNDAIEAASWAAYLAGGVVVGLVASAAIDVATSVGAKQGEANRGGLRDAQTAVSALKAAMPEVDWKQINKQEAYAAHAALTDLNRARTKKILVGLVGVAVAVAIAVGIVLVIQGSAPPTKEEIAAKEQAAFREAQDEIRDLNAILKQTPCDTTAAERRVSLFVKNHQTRTARRLAKQFLDQCGDNAALRAVAHGATAAVTPGK